MFFQLLALQIASATFSLSISARNQQIFICLCLFAQFEQFRKLMKIEATPKICIKMLRCRQDASSAFEMNEREKKFHWGKTFKFSDCIFQLKKRLRVADVILDTFDSFNRGLNKFVIWAKLRWIMGSWKLWKSFH